VLDLIDPADGFRADLAVLDGAARLLGADPLEWVLGGGEDHGLLATFPADVELPAPFRAIGLARNVSEPDRPGQVLVDGAAPSVTMRGWDHFRA